MCEQCRQESVRNLGLPCKYPDGVIGHAYSVQGNTAHSLSSECMIQELVRRGKADPASGSSFCTTKQLKEELSRRAVSTTEAALISHSTIMMVDELKARGYTTIRDSEVLPLALKAASNQELLEELEQRGFKQAEVAQRAEASLGTVTRRLHTYELQSMLSEREGVATYTVAPSMEVRLAFQTQTAGQACPGGVVLEEIDYKEITLTGPATITVNID